MSRPSDKFDDLVELQREQLEQLKTIAQSTANGDKLWGIRIHWYFLAFLVMAILARAGLLDDVVGGAQQLVGAARPVAAPAPAPENSVDRDLATE